MSTALAKKILELDRAYPPEPGAQLGSEEFCMLGIDWAELVGLAEAESKPFRVAILACSASKLSTPARARDMYTGALFKASLAVASRMADHSVILSAKHHLVQLDDVLEPYDHSLAAMQKHQREIWGALVAKKLEAEFGYRSTHVPDPRDRQVLCLAPASYVDYISIYGKREWSMPLKGKGIGQQKATLKQLAGAS